MTCARKTAKRLIDDLLWGKPVNDARLVAASELLERELRDQELRDLEAAGQQRLFG